MRKAQKSLKVQGLIRCKHIHLSGRRCAQLMSRRDVLGKPRIGCLLHLNPEYCRECVAMMSAFAPAKGWSNR